MQFLNWLEKAQEALQDYTRFIDRIFFFSAKILRHEHEHEQCSVNSEHASDFHPNRGTVVFGNKRGDDITFVLLI